MHLTPIHTPSLFLPQNRGQGEERSSDDGEPGGTAGRPILSAIESEDLVNVMVVVTRYERKEGRREGTEEGTEKRGRMEGSGSAYFQHFRLLY